MTMMNYMKSDLYRLSKKKFIYALVFIIITLLILLAVVVEYFRKTNPDFPYGTTKFFYSNVFGFPGLLLALVCLLASSLLGKDRQLISSSIAMRISRRNIYIGKFLVTLLYTVGIYLILGTAAYLAGENIISTATSSVAKDYVVSLVNLAPILLSAFCIMYACTFIFGNELVAAMIVFLLYRMMAIVVIGLGQVSSSFTSFEKYYPANEMSNILVNVMDGNVTLNWRNWLINIPIGLVVFVVGLKIMEKKDYQ